MSAQRTGSIPFVIAQVGCVPVGPGGQSISSVAAVHGAEQNEPGRLPPIKSPTVVTWLGLSQLSGSQSELTQPDGSKVQDSA
jgi:hypothetical protein